MFFFHLYVCLLYGLLLQLSSTHLVWLKEREWKKKKKKNQIAGYRSSALVLGISEVVFDFMYQGKKM